MDETAGEGVSDPATSDRAYCLRCPRCHGWGESGLLAACWSGDKIDAGEPIGHPSYESSKRRVTWANGAVATLFSAEEPERLRGSQAEAVVRRIGGVEASARDLGHGLRLGDRPRTCITTTPKPLKILREIMQDKLTVVTRGSTFMNSANLAPTFLKAIEDKYKGTRLGRQELEAEVLEEAEGALWSRAMIEASSWKGSSLPEIKRIVVAVDPAVTAKEESAESGIVAAGVGRDDRGYVMRDVSGRCHRANWHLRQFRSTMN